MAIPADPVLRASIRWLGQLSSSSLARSQVLFSAHTAFGDLTPTQYAAALAWLQRLGIVDEAGRYSPGPRVEMDLFEAIIADARWLPDADVLVGDGDELPEDASRAADVLGIEHGESLAAVRKVWGKVDTALRSRIGAAGEVALVELICSSTDLTVSHVAAESDGFGYDISVDIGGGVLHLEVKSTTRRGRLTIFLSRHEYETMRRDSSWILTAVRLNEKLEPVAVATVDRGWIERAAPQDRESAGRWESMRLEVPESVLEPGLSGLGAALRFPPCPLLTGSVVWPG